MLEQTSGIISPHQSRKYIHVNKCQQTIFEAQLPRFQDPSL